MFDKNHDEKISKLPSNAQIVHHGPLFTVHQWDQKLYDGSSQLYELCECRDAALVLAEKDGYIYFPFQSQSGIEKPFYSLFGGYIDPGETPLDAAKRELMEENGMVSDDWELIYKHNPNDKFAKTDFYFVARNCRYAGEKHLDTSEKINEHKLTIEQFFATMPFDKNMRDANVLRAIFCKQFSDTDLMTATKILRGE